MVKRLAIFLLISASAFLPSAAFAKSQQIVKVATDIEIPKEMVASDVVTIGGNVTVYGRVENSVVAVGGSVILKPRS